MGDHLDYGWQMREVKFDVDSRLLKLTAGEVLIDKIENVEDTKGNNGDRGVMRITNIRMIWHATTIPRVNLSIGYHSIMGFNNKTIVSKIRGTECEALYVHAKLPGKDTRFEFIFTAIANQFHKRLFNTLTSVHRAYETSKLYREIRLRGAVITDIEELRLLPQEHILDKITGVFNMSLSEGSLGTLFITNVRIVWYSTAELIYNISLPHIRITFCRLRTAPPHGAAMILDTNTGSSEVHFAFKITPEYKLIHVITLIQHVNQTARSKPVFGVQVTRGPMPHDQILYHEPLDHIEDDVEIDEKPMRADAFAAYFASGHTLDTVSKPAPPVFSEELGLAIEPLRAGFTLSDLWNVHVD